MISNQLDPLRFAIEQNHEFSAECLGLCLLASYNTEAIQPRVLDSFQHAYAMNNIIQKPVVPDGKPGYAVSYWETPDVRRVTVAIEGMRSYSQLRNFWSGYSVSPWMNGEGHVFGAIAAHATAIRDELLATPAFAAFWNLPGTNYVFTGHSLGAMIAELLGEIFKLANPGKNIKVVKFGSPRIGSTRYVNRRNRNVIRESWYYRRDPIDILPYFSASSNIIDLLPITGGPGTWLQRDPDAFRGDENAHSLDDFHVGGMVQAAWALRQFYLPRDQTNPFWDHSILSYRHMFTTLCDHTRGLIRWRFRYLEFNDENQWGLQFLRGTSYHQGMVALVTPSPAAVEVDVEDLPRDETLSGGGTDWGQGDQPRLVANFEDNRFMQPLAPDAVQPEVARVPAVVAPAANEFNRITPNRRRTGRWSGAQGR